MKTLPNIHPGEVLLEEFLMPMGISQDALAQFWLGLQTDYVAAQA